MATKDGNRFHLTAGGTIECSGSGNLKECPICNIQKKQKINEWLNACRSACVLCAERPPCYLCIRHKCEDWLIDKALLKELGSHHGCNKLSSGIYCSEFFCKHGLKGWWNPTWKKSNFKVMPKILRKLHKRKVAEVKAKSKGERDVPKGKKQSSKVSVVASKSVEDTGNRSIESPVGKRHSNVHRKKRIPMRKKSST